jgi:hypothetical protein
LSLCLIDQAPLQENVLRSGVEWLASRHGHFIPGERAPGTHCMGGWVGASAGLDRLDAVE